MCQQRKSPVVILHHSGLKPAVCCIRLVGPLRCIVTVRESVVKATTGDRPHIKLWVTAKVNDVQIYLATKVREVQNKVQ
jgi:hypothetical protein